MEPHTTNELELAPGTLAEDGKIGRGERLKVLPDFFRDVLNDSISLLHNTGFL